MGRPRADPARLAEALRLCRAGDSPESASATMRERGTPIGIATIRRAQVAARKPGAKPPTTPPRAPATPKVPPVPLPAPALAHPEPPAPAGPALAPSKLRELVADAVELAARDAPEAERAPPVVAEGTPAERLRAYAAHDPQAAQLLTDLLSPPAALSGDSLATVRVLLDELVRDFRRASSVREKGVLADKINGQIKTVERILRSRPRPVPPDAVLEELRRLDAEAIALIEQHLPEPITAAELAA